MPIKFSEDLVSLTDMKVNPGRVVKHATDVRRPVLLTSRGRGVAVVQSVSDDENAEEERELMRAVVAGLADLVYGARRAGGWNQAGRRDVSTRSGFE